ncbi:ATP-binding protein [Streptomyces sp. T1317-0309]|nr:ATP-binding protein [Streptomyces sp. T1317-0309]
MRLLLVNMKIAFVGKGGSGKTTLSSLFIRHLAAAGATVVAVDADINQHLGAALGLEEDEAAALPAMGDRLRLIKDYLRGRNPRIASADTMIKTTPPGEGSRLLRVAGGQPGVRRLRAPGGARRRRRPPDGHRTVHGRRPGGRLLPLQDGSGGTLPQPSGGRPGRVRGGRHDGGSDSFASGMFTRFDMTFLVAEPTRKGVSVYRQYKEYARDFGVALKVVGNKVHGQDDIDFLRTEVGDDLLVTVGQSDWVRSMEKGRPPRFELLEDANRRSLRTLRAAADAMYGVRDWQRYTRQMVHFHLKNAASWGNERTGADLAAQIDPGFVLNEGLAAV